MQRNKTILEALLEAADAQDAHDLFGQTRAAVKGVRIAAELKAACAVYRMHREFEVGAIVTPNPNCAPALFLEPGDPVVVVEPHVTNPGVETEPGAEGEGVLRTMRIGVLIDGKFCLFLVDPWQFMPWSPE